MKYAGKRGTKHQWLCQCDCNSDPIVVAGGNLKSGNSTKCRNPYHKVEQYIGKRFSRLTVLSYDGCKNKNNYLKCKCDCGNIVSVRSDCLLNNSTRSCGCLQKDYFKTNFDGVTHEKLYYVWAGMKSRCGNKKPSYV